MQYALVQYDIDVEFRIANEDIKLETLRQFCKLIKTSYVLFFVSDLGLDFNKIFKEIKPKKVSMLQESAVSAIDLLF